MESKCKMEVNRKITRPSPLLCGQYNKPSVLRGSDSFLLHCWTSLAFSQSVYVGIPVPVLWSVSFWNSIPFAFSSGDPAFLCAPSSLLLCSPFYKQIQARNSLWNQRNIFLIQTVDLPFVLPSPLSGILAQMALLFGSMPRSCQGTKLFISKHGCKGSQRMLLHSVR